MPSLTSKDYRHRNLLALLAEAEAKGANKRDFALSCGISPSFLSQLLSRTREIGDHTARKIETALSLGRGGLDVFMADADHAAAAADLDEFVEVPVLGTVDRGADDEVEVPFYTGVSAAAGDGSHNGDQVHKAVKLRFRKVSLRRKGIDPAHARVIYVKGDSMEPLMSDGDQIMFDASRTAIRDGELYVIRVDRDEMVKRLHKRPGDRVVVQSENPAFAPYEVGLEDPGFAVLGQVVWRAGWM
jgi:hypothetical protein